VAKFADDDYVRKQEAEAEALAQRIREGQGRRNGHEPAAEAPQRKRVVAPKIVTAADLMAADLPDIQFAVPGLIPEGATILAAPPKTGKSFLILGVCVAVASGGLVLGSTRVDRGSCLYLALEDGPRRMRRRLSAMLSAWGGTVPSGLYVSHEWPKLGDGGIDEIERFLQDHPDCRLVVIDTLARMRDRRGSVQDLYGDDYEAIAKLQRLALKYHVGILIVHHTRKSRSDGGDADQLETVSGTMGLTGAADAVLVLRRRRQEKHGKLFVTGRDIEERELNLAWEPRNCHWEESAAPTGPDAELTPDRRAIRQAARDAKEPISIADAVKALKKAGIFKEYDSVAQLLGRMEREGFLKKQGWGRYTLPDEDVSKLSNCQDEPEA
jgi:AAA domain